MELPTPPVDGPSILYSLTFHPTFIPQPHATYKGILEHPPAFHYVTRRFMKSSLKRVKLRSGDAILLIDVMNDLDFPGGDKILPWAIRLAPLVRATKSRALAASIPVIYVNDNYGRWGGTWREIFAHCARKGALGARVTRSLKPTKDDIVLLKPRHSAFFGTPLNVLLEELGVRRLILAGMATNLCVLMTAYDAKMNGYPIIVLSDCCAAESDFDHNLVLRQLQQFFDAEICTSTQLVFPKRAAAQRAAAHSG